MDDGVLVLRKKGKNNHSSFPFSHQLLKFIIERHIPHSELNSDYVGSRLQGSASISLLP